MKLQFRPSSGKIARGAVPVRFNVVEAANVAELTGRNWRGTWGRQSAPISAGTPCYAPLHNARA